MSGATRSAIWGVVVTGVILAAVVAGLRLAGSPSEERARQADERRVTDLRALAAAIDGQWTLHERLPMSLDSLPDDPGVREHLRDPVTGEPYELSGVSGDRFRLCADFATESADDRLGVDERRWSHPAGYHCFELRARSRRR